MRAERFGETVSKTLHDVSIFYISSLLTNYSFSVQCTLYNWVPYKSQYYVIMYYVINYHILIYTV